MTEDPNAAQRPEPEPGERSELDQPSDQELIDAADPPVDGVLVRPTRLDAALAPRGRPSRATTLAAVRRRVVQLRDNPATLVTASLATVGAGLAVTAARHLLSAAGSGAVPPGPVAVQVSGVVEVLHQQLAQPQVVHHVVHHVHHHLHHYWPGPDYRL